MGTAFCKHTNHECIQPLVCAHHGTCRAGDTRMCSYSKYLKCRANGCRAMSCPRIMADRSKVQVMELAVYLMEIR